MGKTNPTFRDQITEFEAALRNMRRALRRERQPAFQAVVEHMHATAMAAGAANLREPRRAMLLSVCVEQQRQLRELQAYVEEFDERIAALERGDGSGFDAEAVPDGQGRLAETVGED